MAIDASAFGRATLGGVDRAATRAFGFPAKSAVVKEE